MQFSLFRRFNLRNVIIGKHVSLFGDLLGRERVTGAKNTRAGCDYSCKKFECTVEAAALWHAKQSFLGVRLNFFRDFVCN